MQKISTILLIEDEVEILDILSEVLRQWGFNTFAVESVKEAVTILQSHHVDLVISDFQMPEENGLVLLEFLKKFNKQNDLSIPFIFISGESGMSKEEAISIGASAYFDKPVSLKDLKKLIDSFL